MLFSYYINKNNLYLMKVIAEDLISSLDFKKILKSLSMHGWRKIGLYSFIWTSFQLLPCLEFFYNNISIISYLNGLNLWYWVIKTFITDNLE